MREGQQSESHVSDHIFFLEKLDKVVSGVYGGSKSGQEFISSETPRVQSDDVW